MIIQSENDLKSWMGIGLGFEGSTESFRPKEVEGYRPLDPKSSSHVEYVFFKLFYFPIIPIDCYRLNSGSRDIIKKENIKTGEVLSIYFRYIITLGPYFGLLLLGLCTNIFKEE